MCLFNNKKKSMSFLLGAGFSVPAGYPTGKVLGGNILKTTKDDIWTYYGNLYNKGDNHETYIEFLLRLQTIYYTIHGNFNYEEFYDFLKSKHSENCCFLKKMSNTVGIKDSKTSISDIFEQIDDIYNQLVAFHINNNKKPNLAKYTKYKSLVSSYVDDNYVVNVHTLNHDLLFENIFDDAVKKYCDGFVFNKRKGVYEYSGSYVGNLLLFKMHGSLNYYNNYTRINNTNQIQKDPKQIKLPPNVSLQDIKLSKEVIIPVYHPDFLTGIQYKQTRYEEEFYNELQKKFIANLKTADKLIIIGYSGNDGGINDYIIDNLKRDAACFVLDYKEDEAKEVIHRIGLRTKRKDIRCYAVKSDLENVKESDFEETTYPKVYA